MEQSDRYTGWVMINMGFVARQAWVSNVTQSLNNYEISPLSLTFLSSDFFTCKKGFNKALITELL